MRTPLYGCPHNAAPDPGQTRFQPHIGRRIMQHKQLLVIAAAAALWSGCVDQSPLGPHGLPAPDAQFATVPGEDTDGAMLATLRRVTAPYHDVNVAISEGFFQRHPCETLEEGPVGVLYVNRD